MMGLLLKDVLNLKKYLRQLLIVSVIMIIFYMQLGSISFIYFMLAMMFSMVVITTISYDELAKWDKYALTMPLSRRDIVTSKFLFLLLANVTGLVISFVISIVDYYLNGTNIKESSLLYICAFLIGIVWFSIILPIIFKLGVERARLFMILIFFIPSISIVGIAKLLQKTGMPKPDFASLEHYLWLLPVVCLAIYVGMYFLSLNIYSKKEL